MAQTLGPITRLNELIKGIDTAILTTVRSDGSLHSCPMASHAADEGGFLWFLSDNNTEKVEAVRTNQRVNVAYINHNSHRYVSVSGCCELVRDHERTTQLWNPSYASWFPAGLDDPRLILMKVDVQQADYWDASQARMVPLVGFARAAVE